MLAAHQMMVCFVRLPVHRSNVVMKWHAGNVVS